MSTAALLIGNSDGIGLATTEALLERGWRAAGISKSESPIADPRYEHHVADVRDDGYTDLLRAIIAAFGPVDLCIYCAGIGELLDPATMVGEIEVFAVNLLGMVRTVECVIPRMVERGAGHFIGLSSVADALLSPEAPSYHASKAGVTSYLESLALALAPRGVCVSNVRFGFVDTKMAKGDVKPFMMSVPRAVAHMLKCIEKRPARYTAPRIAIPLVGFRNMMLRSRLR
jgi:NAD(P)-dependent dehydrogenase (short-subunit alcohol dehydrogenase family)